MKMCGFKLGMSSPFDGFDCNGWHEKDLCEYFIIGVWKWRPCFFVLYVQLRNTRTKFFQPQKCENIIISQYENKVIRNSTRKMCWHILLHFYLFCWYTVNFVRFCKFLSRRYRPSSSHLALFLDVVSRESLFMYASYPLISTKMPHRKNPQFMNAKIPPIFSTS